MRLNLPAGLLDFARDASSWKTPPVRTQGFAETGGQVRGAGDILDTVAGWMTWRWLVSQGVPATHLHTALCGDSGDVMIHGARNLSVNVKASSYVWPGDAEDLCHMAIKAVELGKPFDLYIQVLAHLDDEPHVHLCGCVPAFKLDTPIPTPVWERQTLSAIPGTDGCQGYWIPASEFLPLDGLVARVGR